MNKWLTKIMTYLFNKYFLRGSDVSGTVLYSKDSKRIKTWVQTLQSSYMSKGDRPLTISWVIGYHDSNISEGCGRLEWVTNPVCGPEKASQRKWLKMWLSMLRHKNIFEKHCGKYWELAKVLKQELSCQGIRNTLQTNYVHLQLIYQFFFLSRKENKFP